MSRGATGAGFALADKGIAMRKKSFGLLSAIAIGLTVTSMPPAVHAADAVLYVPESFNSVASDTRATGDYEVAGTGLHIWTTGATGTDKVAEYVDTHVALALIGEPTLEYNNTSGGGVPGYQLVIDFDSNGSPDGILVGEPGVYGNDWWASNGSAAFVKGGAPSTSGGSGSGHHGTLDQWRTAFPTAVVKLFGFSLGSGVLGNGTLDAINFNGTRYTFGVMTILDGREACKKGGWETSTHPAFSNQGDCVSHFATDK